MHFHKEKQILLVWSVFIIFLNLFLFTFFEEISIHIFELDDDISGLFIGIIIVIISSIALIIRFYKHRDPFFIFCLWFTLSAILIMDMGILFERFNFNILNIDENNAGFILGLIISIVSFSYICNKFLFRFSGLIYVFVLFWIALVFIFIFVYLCEAFNLEVFELDESASGFVISLFFIIFLEGAVINSHRENRYSLLRAVIFFTYSFGFVILLIDFLGNNELYLHNLDEVETGILLGCSAVTVLSSLLLYKTKQNTKGVTFIYWFIFSINFNLVFYYFIFPDKRIIIDDHLHYYNNPVSIYFGIVICVTILILLYIYKRISTKIQNNRSAEIKSDIN